MQSDRPSIVWKRYITTDGPPNSNNAESTLEWHALRIQVGTEQAIELSARENLPQLDVGCLDCDCAFVFGVVFGEGL